MYHYFFLPRGSVVGSDNLVAILVLLNHLFTFKSNLKIMMGSLDCGLYYIYV